MYSIRKREVTILFYIILYILLIFFFFFFINKYSELTENFLKGFDDRLSHLENLESM